MTRVEGSQLGMHLLALKREQPLEFEKLMNIQKQSAASVVDRPKPVLSDSPPADNRKAAKILIAVSTCRKKFVNRVRAIRSTWGNPENLPDNISVRFFVGEAAEEVIDDGSHYDSLTIEQDKIFLARSGGIEDLRSIHVMSNVTDDEYPPVRKTGALIRNLATISMKESYDWIFKVDDDTYVNVDGLERFIHSKNATDLSFWGQRGYGRKEDKEGLLEAGMDKPYCTGGPGYIFSRPTLLATAPNIPQCIEEAEKSHLRQFLWHSDVVVGYCTHKTTQLGCWEAASSNSDFTPYSIKDGPFRQNYKNVSAAEFPTDMELIGTVSVHPFKAKEGMIMLHQRFEEAQQQQQQTTTHTSETK